MVVRRLYYSESESGLKAFLDGLALGSLASVREALKDVSGDPAPS